MESITRTETHLLPGRRDQLAKQEDAVVRPRSACKLWRGWLFANLDRLRARNIKQPLDLGRPLDSASRQV